MSEADRKLAWSGVFVLAVIAAEIAWFLFVGPANHSYSATAASAANGGGDKDYPWWQYSGAWIAIFTIVLTFSTAALWLSTRDAARVAARSVELARAEFIASHKPEMAITFVRLLPERTSRPSDQQERHVEIGLVNKGGSKANVTGAFASFEILYPASIPYPITLQTSPNIWIGPRSFQPGATDRYDVPTDQHGGAQICSMGHIGKLMVVYGWIVYEDSSEDRNTRTYYFCRVCKGEGAPFRVDTEREVTY
jgi:hypothetical protein